MEQPVFAFRWGRASASKITAPLYSDWAAAGCLRPDVRSRSRWPNLDPLNYSGKAEGSSRESEAGQDKQNPGVIEGV